MAIAPAALTQAAIRQQLSVTTMPEDPSAARMPDGARHLPRAMQGEMSGRLKAAGVLVPLIERKGGLNVLFTVRASDLTLHAGQVSFPGGRMESADIDIRATALRETQEEVGIHPQQVEVVGYLPPTATVTCYAVTPVVGFVDPHVRLSIDPVEVKTAFEVPLHFLMDKANQKDAEREFAGRMLPMTSFSYGEHRIWGATAGMLVQLRTLLL